MLIGLYVADWATSFPKPIPETSVPGNSQGASLTLETVAAIGPKYSPSHPSWVSYLIRSNGQWVHSTNYTVPANSVVHVTIYQFDTPTGLRNPFLSQVQGTEGGTATIDGKTVNAIEPEEASHTFAVPELGVFVPLPGVNEEAKNLCEEAPCEMNMRAPHDQLQLPHRQEGPLPLAVLRPVRRRLVLRQRRPDADLRLHGRVHQCRLTRPRRNPRTWETNRTTRAALRRSGSSRASSPFPW